MSLIFAERLKNARQKKNLSQNGLAELIGVSASTVGMYEQGRREPGSKILQKLCSVLDTSTDYLLGISKNIEVDSVIDDFTQMLLNQEGLMFNGKPVTDEDRKKIADAIKLAAAITAANCNKEE